MPKTERRVIIYDSITKQFFTSICDIPTDNLEKEQALFELFKTIMLNWNNVDDIDYSLLNEDILLLLLEKSDELTQQLLSRAEYINKLYQNLVQVNRVKCLSKKRLL